MWKVIIIAALIVTVVVVAVILLGKGGGIGPNIGPNNTIVDSTSMVSTESDITEDETTESEEQEEDVPDSVKGTIIRISVVNNEYIYDNERITIDDFLTIVSQTQEECIVEVADDNASIDAYDKLIEKLKENKIKYDERNVY